jgi:hypothetical protein
LKRQSKNNNKKKGSQSIASICQQQENKDFGVAAIFRIMAARLKRAHPKIG